MARKGSRGAWGHIGPLASRRSSKVSLPGVRLDQLERSDARAGSGYVSPQFQAVIDEANARAQASGRTATSWRSNRAIAEMNPLEPPPIGCPEAFFQEKVEAAARRLGWRVYHAHIPLLDARGWPDGAFVHERHMRFLVAELKDHKGRTSEDQQAWLNGMACSGVPTYLWRPVDWSEIVMVLSLTGQANVVTATRVAPGTLEQIELDGIARSKEVMQAARNAAKPVKPSKASKASGSTRSKRSAADVAPTEENVSPAVVATQRAT